MSQARRSAAAVAAMMPPPPPQSPRSALRAPGASSLADAAVQGTNDDATVSKLSAVQLGYWDDPFLRLFVRKPTRRPPLINRGYYARVAAIRQLMLRFLAAGGDAERAPPAKQVVSLGAGFDTLFFGLAAAGVAPARYVEVDFAEARPAALAFLYALWRPLTPDRAQTTARKAAVLARSPELLALLADGGSGDDVRVDAAAGAADSRRYALRSADLRQPEQVAAALASAGVDLSAPTLVLLECVLVYMEPPQAAELLRWAAAALPTAAVLIYDPTRPHDAFGQQMLLNLAARGCPLVGIAGGAEPVAHAARLRSAGWARAAAADMNEVYRRFLEPGPRAAAERREMLDEIEEWTLIQRHYVLALGGVLGSLSLEPAAAFDS